MADTKTTPHASLTAALAAFQAELPDVGKNSTNPHFKSKYADLADVVKVVLPALAKQGLAWVAAPTLTDHGFVLAYELRHTSGESIKGEWPLPDATGNAQALGSAVTYAKRYTLSAVTGIAPDEDDDGNAAQSATRSRPAPKQKPAPAGWEDAIDTATALDALTGIYNRANAEGWLTGDVMDALNRRKGELTTDGT